jgi:tripartite ATP-independent transporter DctM subunit
MNPELISLLLLLSLLVLLTLGFPVAFCLFGSILVFTLIFLGVQGLGVIVSNSFLVMVNDVYIAIPLFILMSSILEYSGIAADIYDTANKWVGGIQGGLASASVVACTIIAALTGSGGTGVLTLGLIGFPQMMKRGYDKVLAAACIPAASTLGPLIPPSIMMIMIGGLANISVGKLFMGGVFPGLLLSFLMICSITIRCYLNPKLGPASPPEERSTWKQKVISLRGVMLPISIVILVMGAIYSGAATPTEAASFGAAGAFLSAVVKRKVTVQNMKKSVQFTLTTTCMVLWIIMGGVCFSSFLAASGMTEYVKSLFLGLPLSSHYVVVLFLLISLILGCFIDTSAIIMICTPLFFPVVVQLGIDSLWFAILFVVTLIMAYITPPYGTNLFFMKAIVPKDSGVTMADIYRGVIPFVFAQLVGLAILFIFPKITLFLPNHIK